MINIHEGIDAFSHWLDNRASHLEHVGVGGEREPRVPPSTTPFDMSVLPHPMRAVSPGCTTSSMRPARGSDKQRNSVGFHGVWPGTKHSIGGILDSTRCFHKLNDMIALRPIQRLMSMTFWLCTAAVPLPRASAADTDTTAKELSIPYVPTRQDTVRDLLWLANVSSNDIVYDMGSGDGRVVIAAVRDFHARRAVGIELDARLVEESRSNAVRAGVADRVEFIHGDLFTNDFSAASVLVLYLGHRPNLDLRHRIFQTLKPGSRVVSHQFGMGEWNRDKRLTLRQPLHGMFSISFNEFSTNPNVPDFDDSPSLRDHTTLSAWVVPAPVAGIWRGNVQTDSGEAELKLTLHQRLSGLNGFFDLRGGTNLQGRVEVDLWGDHLRCWCVPTNGNWTHDQMWIDGRVRDGLLSGGLRMRRGTNWVETPWTARRDDADFIGTWEWPGASNAPVQLKLERRDGRLVATYADQNREKKVWRDETKPVPVFDMYDFGGGFYFTLLLGLESGGYTSGGRRAGPQNGWVIGEAVMDEGSLKGTLAFYPYGQRSIAAVHAAWTQPKVISAPVQSDWRPKRVSPQ